MTMNMPLSTSSSPGQKKSTADGQFSALAILALAFTAQACTYCQCKFENGSHCCVYSDSEIGNSTAPLSVQRLIVLMAQARMDKSVTPCNAGGSYKCASAFTALDRTPCYKQ
ncbi:hypothetical protein DID88_000759 [Monilinia fructigena]|uniref:Uncharacterized protein n=1 Tax=Monilinia fructigena TaxID=38457 RepID=A0A395IJR9_9HELO|nr:hypothetical protein DID88_000759 [Monilinia fructigena]